MVEIGVEGELKVIECSREQVLLDGEQLGPIALASHAVPSVTVGDTLPVFLYTDSHGKPLATLAKPIVQRGQCASLKIVDITNAGAFLDWGLEKNLLLPFAEQRRPVEIGRYETVLVYLDNSGRLAASSRLDHHLPDTDDHFRPWQQVTLLIYQRTDLGLKAVVDNRAVGLLYKDEIFQSLRVGETHTGYIKRLRFDGRIDLSMQPRAEHIKPVLSEVIMQYLRDNGGACELSDKSSPEAIQAVFHVSKKNFKKAISALYKERKIVIHPQYIELADSNDGS